MSSTVRRGRVTRKPFDRSRSSPDTSPSHHPAIQGSTTGRSFFARRSSGVPSPEQKSKRTIGRMDDHVQNSQFPQSSRNNTNITAPAIRAMPFVNVMAYCSRRSIAQWSCGGIRLGGGGRSMIGVRQPVGGGPPRGGPAYPTGETSKSFSSPLERPAAPEGRRAPASSPETGADSVLRQ